jgi:uncharacterized protein DUF4255
MSNALAIASVTAVLRDLLNDGLINHNVTGAIGTAVAVSVRSPDRVVVGDTETSQLNVFLHQVTPNSGWRNVDLPSLDERGRTRIARPPLALDLHYLISAYSGADFHAEILLGYAMQLLHENPVITRSAIRRALRPSADAGGPLPDALRALENSGLENQVEQVKFTLEILNTEELSKLWTATQSHLRPTAAYRATVVLIQSEDPVRTPLPVLTRGRLIPGTTRDRGVVVTPNLLPPVPTIDRVSVEAGQPVVQLGRLVTLVGSHLDGTNREVFLINARREVEETIAAVSPGTASAMEFRIPAGRAADFPVGAYEVAGRVVPPGETAARETNRLSFTLAPDLTVLPNAPVAVDGAGTASFSVSFTPAIRTGQSAVLLLGQHAFAPEDFADGDTTLDFVIESAPRGDFVARLRIDGIDSPIIDRTATPPAFLDRRIVIQ